LAKADCELDSNQERNLNANFECQQGFANSEFWLALDFSRFSPQNLKCQST
jgi:hypothetical protein